MAKQQTKLINFRQISLVNKGMSAPTEFTRVRNNQNMLGSGVEAAPGEEENITEEEDREAQSQAMKKPI